MFSGPKVCCFRFSFCIQYSMHLRAWTLSQVRCSIFIPFFVFITMNWFPFGHIIYFCRCFSFTSSLICFQVFQVFELSGGFTDCHSAFLLFDLAGSVSLHSRFSRKSEPLSAPFFQAECLPLSFESQVVIIGLVPHSWNRFSSLFGIFVKKIWNEEHPRGRCSLNGPERLQSGKQWKYRRP